MRSFRLKTVFLTASLSGTLLIATGSIAWLWLKSEFQDSLDAKIILPGQRIAEYHGWKTDWKRFERTIDIAIGEDWKSDRILKVRSNMFDRNTLYQSDNWPSELPTQDTPRFAELSSQIKMIKHDRSNGFTRYSLLDAPHLYTASDGESEWRMAAVSNPELTLYIGINLDRYHARIHKLRILYFGILILVIIGIALGAYWISTRALRPVEAIANAAKAISTKRLNQRIASSNRFDEEFDSLISVINQMLDRLDTSFRQAMRFSADASHELRTPLTIIQSEIATRLQTCDTGSEEQQTLNRLMEETQRLKRIIRSLFLLSEADSGKMPLTLENYDFSEQLETFARDTEILVEDSKLTAETAVELGLFVHADKMLIGQVIQNLISNAINHNTPNGFVKWQLSAQDEHLVFTIENSGHPISQKDQERIFERFYRGDRTRSGKSKNGLGLGLSLAKEISNAHLGNLSLIRSDETSTVFELRLSRCS